MSVAQILAEKGRETYTIEGRHTLEEAVAMLRRHRVGAVVVVGPGGAVEGILSERDVVKAIAESGSDALQDLVSERMTRKVATCEVSARHPGAQ